MVSDGWVLEARERGTLSTMQHFYQDIHGWFDFDDIYRDAAAEARDGSVFVEVGTWCGKSAAYMAVEIVNSGKKIGFYCVDTWKGSPAAQCQSVMQQEGDVFMTFTRHMAAGGVGHITLPLVSDSAAASAHFVDESVDFVFVDAAHDFDGVRRDIAAWLPKVRVGGVIAGHDAGCPGLLNAVYAHIPGDEVVLRGGSWFHRVARRVSSFEQRVAGVRDARMEESTEYDMWHRLLLAGVITTAPPRPLGPCTNYALKWGGTPGHETFLVPYNVTTKDW